MAETPFWQRHMVTILLVILSIGLVATIFSIQNNYTDDLERAKSEAANLELVVCHGIADRNQALKDLFSLITLQNQITVDMDADQKISASTTNEQRKNYLIMLDSIFPAPMCSDGYKATSFKLSLIPFLVPPTTTPSGGQG